MAGYSGTPLAKKLGIKEGAAIALVRTPDDVQAELAAVTPICRTPRPASRTLDFVLMFVTSQRELTHEFSLWAQRIVSNGMIWVAWPKKSAGVVSDLDENRVREIGLAAGLVDVKVCAVNHIWSGLKFVIRLKDRV